MNNIPTKKIRCAMSIYNVLGFPLFLYKHHINYGIPVCNPPAVVEAFSIGTFLVEASSVQNLTYQGIEATLIYQANNTALSEFRFYCNIPYNGLTTASISNPDRNNYYTHFICGPFDGGPGDTGHCQSDNGSETRIKYNIKHIKAFSMPDDKQVVASGSTYIKVTNISPYKLKLISSTEHLGFWEINPSHDIKPFSSTSWAHLFQDIATGQQSKGSLMYAYYDAQEKSTVTLEMDFYNPKGTLEDDECRSQQAGPECSSTDLNFARITNPEDLKFSTYFECSIDNIHWNKNYCENYSDLLYIHFYFVKDWN